MNYFFVLIVSEVLLTRIWWTGHNTRMYINLHQSVPSLAQANFLNMPISFHFYAIKTPLT
jgi:hypothetical protein